MSVIVKEIDMPENCLECQVNCLRIGRKAECPLKSVDGLIEKIDKLAYSETEYGIEEFDASKIVRLDDLVEVIKEYCGMEEEK